MSKTTVQMRDVKRRDFVAQVCQRLAKYGCIATPSSVDGDCVRVNAYPADRSRFYAFSVYWKPNLRRPVVKVNNVVVTRMQESDLAIDDVVMHVLMTLNQMDNDAKNAAKRQAVLPTLEDLRDAVKVHAGFEWVVVCERGESVRLRISHGVMQGVTLPSDLDRAVRAIEIVQALEAEKNKAYAAIARLCEEDEGE